MVLVIFPLILLGFYPLIVFLYFRLVIYDRKLRATLEDFDKYRSSVLYPRGARHGLHCQMVIGYVLFANPLA